MLELSESVQKLVGLSQDLRNQCVLIEVFDVKYLPCHLVIISRCLVDVCQEILVLEEQSPELLEVIDIGRVPRRFISAVNFHLVLILNLIWADSSRLVDLIITKLELYIGW